MGPSQQGMSPRGACCEGVHSDGANRSGIKLAFHCSVKIVSEDWTCRPALSRAHGTMRFGSAAKVLLKCKLKYYRISECMVLHPVNEASTQSESWAAKHHGMPTLWWVRSKASSKGSEVVKMSGYRNMRRAKSSWRLFCIGVPVSRRMCWCLQVESSRHKV